MEVGSESTTGPNRALPGWPPARSKTGHISYSATTRLGPGRRPRVRAGPEGGEEPGVRQRTRVRQDLGSSAPAGAETAARHLFREDAGRPREPRTALVEPWSRRGLRGPDALWRPHGCADAQRREGSPCRASTPARLGCLKLSPTRSASAVRAALATSSSRTARRAGSVCDAEVEAEIGGGGAMNRPRSLCSGDGKEARSARDGAHPRGSPLDCSRPMKD